MPELPEVETVRRGLTATVLNKKLTKITVNRQDLRLPVNISSLEQFHGKKIVRIARRSKYIIIYFAECQAVIIIHLGMSGRLNYHANSLSEKLKHTHVEFCFEDNSQVYFIDPRRFGFIQVIRENDLNDYWNSKKLGVEPLEDTFNAAVLHQKLVDKKVTLKSALLDQRIVAGLGNIYVCEALFLSKLSPEKVSCSIVLDECSNLVKNIKRVLERAITAGGSTLRDHQTVNGEKGYFQFEFNVYGQENKKCKVCLKSPIKRIKQNGRSTFFCTSCQNC